MGELPLTSDLIDDRRRARLRDELLDAGVTIPAGDASELLIDELAYARWGGVHEHRRFGYGCVLNPRDPDIVGEPLADAPRVTDGPGLSELRCYADGRRIFLVRSPDRTPQLVTAPVLDELELVRLHRRAGGTVIRRSDGGLQIVSMDGSVGHYIDSWRLRPSLTDAVDAVGGAVPLDLRDVLCQILDLCMHVLSPRHVGATIVWRLEEPLQDMMTRPPMPGPIELSLIEDRHVYAVAKRVALLDGACVLERDGTVAGFGAFLGWSPETEDDVVHETGLRHSSARWYSHDVPGSLVFVVSEDGPVTVYRGGSDLLTTSTGTEPDQGLRAEPVTW